MANYDLHNNIILKSASDPALSVIIPGGGADGHTIDLIGSNSCELLIHLEHCSLVTGSGTWYWTISHDNDPLFPDFGTGLDFVPAEFIIGDLPSITVTSPADAFDLVYQFGYIGGKRYIKLQLHYDAASAAATEGIFHAEVVLDTLRSSPPAQS